MTVPIRSCVACRRRGAKPSLTRLAVANGTVVPDPSAHLEGRGAYLCHRRSCVDSALDRGGARLLRALGVTHERPVIDEQAIRTAVESDKLVAHTARPGASAGVSE